jgi:uncharacterized protein DUF1501
VPGLHFTELMPLQAKIADKFIVLRSMYQTAGGHPAGTMQLLSGDTDTRDKPQPRLPDWMSVAHYLRSQEGGRKNPLPNCTSIHSINSSYCGPAYLGDAFSAFSVAEDPNRPQFQVPNIGLAIEAETRRLSDRIALRKSLARMERAFDHQHELEALDEFETQAASLLTAPEARDAFDLGQEDAKTRDRYGRNRWGQQLLLARRLVEAGVEIITSSLHGPLCGRTQVWDDHAVDHHIFEALRFRMGYYDQAVAALIEDIHARGLDKRVLVDVIPDIQFASQRDFDRLGGVEFPAGVSGFEESFTGFGQAGPYIAERTPEHMAEVVKTLARNKVKWTHRDGAMGYVRGLQAPAYYVYGRMMDDPSADWRALQAEFCEAAFGTVAKPMSSFFDLLHTHMALYSDFFGVFMPARDRKYSRSRHHDSKWHVMSLYPPELCAEMDTLLKRAESDAKDADVLARLHLIRIDFDYARELARIFYLQNAWTMNPSQVNLDALMDAIDHWHAGLEKMAGGSGRSSFKPLSDWPEMKPFHGHFYTHAALENEGYQQQWNKTCINWDTKAIRAGVLTSRHEIKVPAVDAVPEPDSKAWDRVTESHLRVHDDMPYATSPRA